MQVKFSEVPDLLLSKGIVSSEHAANSTALYLIKWSEGLLFDRSKSSVAVHRARLRKIGLDILKPCTGNGSFPLVFDTNVKGF